MTRATLNLPLQSVMLARCGEDLQTLNFFYITSSRPPVSPYNKFGQSVLEVILSLWIPNAVKGGLKVSKIITGNRLVRLSVNKYSRQINK